MYPNSEDKATRIKEDDTNLLNIELANFKVRKVRKSKLGNHRHINTDVVLTNIINLRMGY